MAEDADGQASSGDNEWKNNCKAILNDVREGIRRNSRKARLYSNVHKLATFAIFVLSLVSLAKATGWTSCWPSILVLIASLGLLIFDVGGRISLHSQRRRGYYDLKETLEGTHYDSLNEDSIRAFKVRLNRLGSEEPPEVDATSD